MRKARMDILDFLKFVIETINMGTVPKGLAVPPKEAPNPIPQKRGSRIPIVQPITVAISTASGANVVVMGGPPMTKAPSHVTHNIINEAGFNCPPLACKIPSEMTLRMPTYSKAPERMKRPPM